MRLRKNTIKEFMDTVYATTLSWLTFCLQKQGGGGVLKRLLQVIRGNIILNKIKILQVSEHKENFTNL